MLFALWLSYLELTVTLLLKASLLACTEEVTCDNGKLTAGVTDGVLFDEEST